MTPIERDEAGTAGICRAWDAAPGGGVQDEHGRVVLALTLALESEGLAVDGKLTPKAEALIRRVAARARKLKKAGAS